uniref:Restriction endonuclease type IV Mrr domain-containing protein n=1 Tax=Ignisphaera aggregans TaxID=334771 RepID=A0A7C2VH94_9CREN
MNSSTVYDFLEKLIKYKKIHKNLVISHVVKYHNLIQSLLDWGIDKGIIEEQDDELVLANPVELLVSLPNFGILPDRFTPYIEWHDFEKYISRVFTEFGWEVYSNYVHTKADRFQIDVIALDAISKLSMFIECKHWKRMRSIQSSIDEIASKHLMRIERYQRNCEWVCIKINKLRSIRYILPTIITLHDLPVKVVNGIPIVPIFKLVDFVINLDRYIDALNLVLHENRCYIKA